VTKITDIGPDLLVLVEKVTGVWFYEPQ